MFLEFLLMYDGDPNRKAKCITGLFTIKLTFILKSLKSFSVAVEL